MENKEELKQILEAKIAKLKLEKKQSKAMDEKSVEKIVKNLSLGNDFIPLVASYFSLHERPSLIWLHLCECTGCSESLLRTANPSFAELIFDLVSLEHHETTMTNSSWHSEENLERLFERGNYILAIEGSGCEDGFFSVGPKAHFANSLVKRAFLGAKAIFAMGTCSSFGGIQTCAPNPIKGLCMQALTPKTIVNVAGCPPSDINIISSLCFFILFDRLPLLDELGRPKLFYGKCLHDMCERKSKYESGLFAKSFDDERVKDGYCLFKVGCKGPYTYNNCPKVKFNAKTSWPVQAGHGCIACSEPDFWDDFGSYEEPLNSCFAYKKKALKSALASDLASTNVKICFKKGLTSIEKNGENYFDFSFSNNPKQFITNFAKTKMAKSLVEEFKKAYPKIYAKVWALDDEEHKSSDILELCAFLHFMLEGEELQDLQSFLQRSKSYAFNHISPYDFKISMKDQRAVFDTAKAMRFAMIYSLGGLKYDAIAYSLLSCIAKNMIICAKNIAKDEKISVYFENEHLKGSVLDSQLYKYLNEKSSFLG